jgi:protein O-mannosyl-transferase
LATPSLSGDAGREGRAARGVLAGGLLLTVLAYLNTFTFAFVYDDHLMKGPHNLHLRSLASFFTHHMFAGMAQRGGYYRPVLLSWVAFVYFFLRQNTVAWHIAALVMHLLVTWLVYLVVRELSRDRMLAALAAAIFGIHPVHVEVVAWVSGAMSEGLLAALVVASLWCYLKARHAERRPFAWYLLSWFLFAAALLVKETAAALPLAILACEWTRAGQQNVDPSMRRPPFLNVAALLAPFLAITAIYVVIRHLVLRGAAAPQTSSNASAAQAWLTLPSAAWFYLRELAWPSRLSLFQPVLRIDEAGLGNFWLPLLGLAIGAALLIAVARRSRLSAFAVCFLAAMLLVPLAAISALPKYEIVHDRYLYLPSIGLAILLALAIRRFSAKMARPGIALLLAGIAVTIGTASFNAYWTNDLTLYRRATAIGPNNAIAFDLLANEMYKRGDAQSSLMLYRHALQLDPRFWATNFSMGITECELGLFQNCERELQAAAEVDPANPAEFALLADARMRLDNYAGAEQALRDGIQASPSAPQLRYLLGLALVRQGKLVDAEQAFAGEVRLNSDWSGAAKQRLEEARTLEREGGWQSWRPGPDYP